MSAVTQVLGRLRDAGLGLVCAVLPRPENERCARAWDVDAATWSGLVGLAQAPSFGLLFLFGAIACVQGVAPRLSMMLLENWVPEMTTEHIRGTGAIGLLVWFIHPLAWFFALEGLTGIARVVAFTASHEAVGEPLVWVGLRAAQLSRFTARRAARSRQLGELRPDRLVWGQGCDLEILSCRERPEWSDAALEVEGHFFRLLAREERPDAANTVLAYRFRELDPNEVIRGLVRYQDIVPLAGAGPGGAEP